MLWLAMNQDQPVMLLVYLTNQKISCDQPHIQYDIGAKLCYNLSL